MLSLFFLFFFYFSFFVVTLLLVIHLVTNLCYSVTDLALWETVKQQKK